MSIIPVLLDPPTQVSRGVSIVHLSRGATMPGCRIPQSIRPPAVKRAEQVLGYRHVLVPRVPSSNMRFALFPCVLVNVSPVAAGSEHSFHRRRRAIRKHDFSHPLPTSFLATFASPSPTSPLPTYPPCSSPTSPSPSSPSLSLIHI